MEISQNGKKVFFFQRKPKSSTGEYICSNYLHPLYGPDGEILTLEFPPDHPYHRGVYWAWHQHFVDGKSIGDGWFMKDISYDVQEVQVKRVGDRIQLRTHVLWRSHLFRNGDPYMDEHTTITVYPVKQNVRKIDFTIALRALVPGFSLGGSADEKGYGGFCWHIRMPDDLTFTSSTGRVTPQRLQIKAGPWMDFSAHFGEKISGLTIICHKSDPDYPEPWILRQKGSMQNIVFPGRERVMIPQDKPLILRYRMLVHRGGAETPDIKKFLDTDG